MRKEISVQAIETQCFCDVCSKNTETQCINNCAICGKDVCFKCRVFCRIPSDNQPYTSSTICVVCQKDFNPWLMQLDDNLREYQAKDKQTRIEYAEAILRMYPDRRFTV